MLGRLFIWSLCAMARVDLKVMCTGYYEGLIRPCVDCGLITGSFCDNCLAQERLPNEEWAEGQMTPLCTTCDRTYDECHFCREMKWCTPAASMTPKSERWPYAGLPFLAVACLCTHRRFYLTNPLSSIVPMRNKCCEFMHCCHPLPLSFCVVYC